MNTFRHGYRPMPQGIRGFSAPRCPRCWMLVQDCLCHLVERVANTTRVVLISHWKDAGRTSNTGRVLWLVLGNLEVRFINHRLRHDSLDDLAELPRAALLFPGNRARQLAVPPAGDAQAIGTLIVVDGTWRQARRLVHRHPGLNSLDQVKLPPGPLSAYRARRQTSPERLSTAEAVARALGILEGGGVERAVMRPFRALVRGCLRARGKIHGDERPGAGSGETSRGKWRDIPARP